MNAVQMAAQQRQMVQLRERAERAEAERDHFKAAFKNFHRSLCTRFGYTHDETDWMRDQVSLEEFIVAKIEQQAVHP